MTSYFFDSSAITKRYVVEIGTEWVRQRVSVSGPDSITVAQITSVEIMSALARQAREGRVTPDEIRRLRLRIGTHFASDYLVLTMSPSIVGRAEALLLEYPLRAYDAVQLASALELQASLFTTRRQPPIFVSADRRLLAAAEAEGLATEDPNAH